MKDQTLIELSQLKWRCRRGLLENDLFIERFFHCYEKQLTQQQMLSLSLLMDLSDNDLLDVLLSRKTLQQTRSDLHTPSVNEVLQMLMNASIKKE